MIEVGAFSYGGNMAATRLIALHINKGKTVAQCLADRTDYSENAKKTNDGECQRKETGRTGETVRCKTTQGRQSRIRSET